MHRFLPSDPEYYRRRVVEHRRLATAQQDEVGRLRHLRLASAYEGLLREARLKKTVILAAS